MFRSGRTPGSEKAVLGKLVKQGLAMPRSQLRRYLEDGLQEGWHDVVAQARRILASHDRDIEKFAKGGCPPGWVPQWVRAADISAIPASLILQLVDGVPALNAVDVLRAVLNRSDVSVADVEAIVERTDSGQIDQRATAIFADWDGVDRAKMAAVANLVTTVSLQCICASTGAEHARLFAGKVAHERNVALIAAAAPGAPGLGRTPWLNCSEAARVGEAGIAATLAANSTTISKPLVLQYILANQFDDSIRAQAVMAAMASGDLRYLAYKISQGMPLACWKDPSQQPAFEAVLSVMTADRVVAMQTVAAKDTRKLLGAVTAQAASGAFPVPLVSTLLAHGYPFTKGKKTVADAMANTRLKKTPEAVDAVSEPRPESALALLARIDPERLAGAITTGHRISRTEFNRIHGTVAPDHKRLLRLAVAPMRWNHTTHRLFPEEEQARIRAAIEAAESPLRQLPRLPLEMWCIIFGFVYPSDGHVALGWA